MPAATPPALTHQTIAVTGGFGALGRATGEALRAAGARVALLDVAPAPAVSPVDGALCLGGVQLDEPGAAARALDQVQAHFGALDGLVNIAGGFTWETVEAGNPASWQQMFSMNVQTTLNASQAALRHMLPRGNGRIVNIGALAAGQAGMGMGAYAAAKAGVARLTEAMAEEFKDRGITINAVLPSILDTPANRASMPDADVSRWVQPAALAAVIVFLLSDAAAPINGALIPVKGRV
jgi:NAD(P)-dependent dehydrogenase (short-subunit alcohol dehydrogenase family)